MSRKRKIFLNKNEKGMRRKSEERLPDWILEHGAKVDQMDVAVQVLTYWTVGAPTPGNRAIEQIKSITSSLV